MSAPYGLTEEEWSRLQRTRTILEESAKRLAVFLETVNSRREETLDTLKRFREARQ